MEKFIIELQKAELGKVSYDEKLVNHTTMKVGGPADVLIEPSSVEHLKQLMTLINRHNVEWRVIGRGSNLLVSDKGIKGVVIKLGKGMDDLQIEGTTIRVGGGYSIIVLATKMAREGLHGLQFASGIPGSVGGSVYMNAGAHGSDISKILTRAHVLFPNGDMEWLTNEEMKFSYRTSVLQKERPGIVIEAEFALKEDSSEKIKAEMKKYKDYRRETQPWNHPCSGSIFRNPLPDYAGQLIQEAGLKGYQIGGAKVSELHGNFIVNAGGATSKDVQDLISHIKRTILENKGIIIETEVEWVGNESDFK
ncbi:UDP-N-acetylmuramate dehydrogenase [Jeotgalibacillus proteolyticus]|uniref:UDP-N-acetylenolpyruvoylglucosamine reductase n=1 Tax=Jeotgalibacillus proteolyticus TaxID=2082395 RepID=A0A2S5GGN0_9BACL|nr:UDP-N-acetylmuramate dehydrogenase [Jeotgalibacillus proteolyticus]PPA72136.1 UDP-N-acetylenolpyruvoylglucosamine reductase [Jeotgalibacillus proteolyticus]